MRVRNSNPSIRLFALLLCICLATSDARVLAQSVDGWRTIERSSAQAVASPANSACLQPCVNFDGRQMAFSSFASNLPGTYNNLAYQIFVRNRESSSVVLLSTSFSSSTYSARGNGASVRPAISSTGRYVAFQSDSTDLVTNQFIDGTHIYVVDRDADGNGVFDQTTPASRKTIHLSVFPNGTRMPGSLSPAISASGRFVAFHTAVGPLAPGDVHGTPVIATAAHVFVHDRDFDGNGVFDEPGLAGRSIIQINLRSDGAPAATGSLSTNAALSGDGRFVAFESNAPNLVDDDTNGVADIFVRDRDTDGNGQFDEPGGVSTTRVSVSSQQLQSNGISARPVISTDGRYIAFDSLAGNLAESQTPGVRQVFIHDRVAHRTFLVSAAGRSQGGNFHSYRPSISADGRLIVFQSLATHLIANDTNGAPDVFVWDRLRAVPPIIAAPTTPDLRSDSQTDADSIRPPANLRSIGRVTLDSNAQQSAFGGIQPAISGDGRIVAFGSVSRMLPPSVDHQQRNIYLASPTP